MQANTENFNYVRNVLTDNKCNTQIQKSIGIAENVFQKCKQNM